jgi:hypothetical protein
MPHEIAFTVAGNLIEKHQTGEFNAFDRCTTERPSDRAIVCRMSEYGDTNDLLAFIQAESESGWRCRLKVMM